MVGKGTTDTPRSFCRLDAVPSPASGYWGVPPDGLCLSVFLLVSPEGRPDEVLLGRVDPRADWARIGPLDPARAEAAARGWMLPATHLMYYEGPDDAARRIMDEQLGLGRRAIDRSAVFSETYPSRSRADRTKHWDLHFLQWVRAPADWVPRHPAWTELAFVDPRSVPNSGFARTHDEILELAGLRSGGT